MSDESKKLYKVIQPVVHNVRREIGETLELTPEEAEHLAAFIVPADAADIDGGDNENSDQEGSEQNQDQQNSNEEDSSQSNDQTQQTT